MDRKTFAIEVKQLAENGTFEGFASIYDVPDLGGDIVERSAFRKTLNEGSKRVPLLWDHRSSDVIGTVELEDSPRGLIAKGRLVLSVPVAQNVYDLMREGAVRGLSFGYLVIKSAVDASGLRRLKELALMEVSLTALPMQPEAVVTSVKAAQEPAVDVEALDAFRNAARDLNDFHRRMIDGE